MTSSKLREPNQTHPVNAADVQAVVDYWSVRFYGGRLGVEPRDEMVAAIKHGLATVHTVESFRRALDERWNRDHGLATSLEAEPHGSWWLAMRYGEVITRGRGVKGDPKRSWIAKS